MKVLTGNKPRFSSARVEYLLRPGHTKWLSISVFVVLATTGHLAPGQAIQQGTGGIDVRISGTLMDFADNPISGATIGLAPWNESAWQPLAQSSSTGTFDFRVQLQRGDYEVIAAFGPYKVASKRGRLQNTAPRAFLNVALRAPKDEARSDLPPTPTPPIGLLPSGSFNTGIRHHARFYEPNEASRKEPGDQEFVRVFYATNRPPVPGQPAQYVDGPIPRLTLIYARTISQLKLTYGICDVSIPPTHELGRLERPSIWRFERVEDVNKHIMITKRELFDGETEFRRKLHQAFQESTSEAFVFIHGYNVDFDDAVRRTAQLFRDLRFNGVPILFSWPAQNAWWRYPAAEDVVSPSARQLEEFILHTLMNERLTAVNIIAHSMGNRILTAALERLALSNAHPRFANIVMAAPDINVADFDAVSDILKSSASRTTIYSSSRDVALLTSKAFHTYQRLGEAPPVRVFPGIDTVDASAVRRDILGHSYFGDSATAMRDLFLLLKQRLDPEARYLQPRAIGTLHYWVVPKE